MTVTFSLQSIVFAFTLIGAVVGIFAYMAKAVRWMDRQKAQDKEIEALRAKHNEDQRYINEELTLLTYGVLACLKGLREQGCNGPVTEAVNKIEKHLNRKAHEG